MGQLVAIFVVAAIIFFAPAFMIRMLARIPFRWTFNPANTFAMVVTEKNAVTNDVKGGNIVNVLHGVPGKTLVRKTDDLMKWYFKPGEDPDHQNFLYQRLGVQDMGSIFYKLRTNIDKRERYARDKEAPQTGLKTIVKKDETEHVFFTGEQQVTIHQADTRDRIGLEIKINFVFERKFPVRSVLRLADAPAFLTSQVEEIVNNETSTHQVIDYYGGPHAKKGRKKLAERIDDSTEFKALVERELGLDITTVAIHDVDLLDKDKAIFAEQVKAEKDMEAETIRVAAAAKNLITKTTAEKAARILINDADADRITRVVKPAAENERTVAVRAAEAYEKNTTVTTYAPGKDTMVPLGK